MLFEERSCWTNDHPTEAIAPLLFSSLLLQSPRRPQPMSTIDYCTRRRGRRMRSWEGNWRGVEHRRLRYHKFASYFGVSDIIHSKGGGVWILVLVQFSSRIYNLDTVEHFVSGVWIRIWHLRWTVPHRRLVSHRLVVFPLDSLPANLLSEVREGKGEGGLSI